MTRIFRTTVRTNSGIALCVRLLSPGILAASLVLCAGVSSLHGLQIHGYSPQRHDRLVQFPGAPVYAQTPALNPGFLENAALFRGIGWPAHATDWTRQMALVSPRHFVYATHYPLGADWRIAFLGADGNQHTFGIASQTPVVNQLGQTTDLMLCTLSTAIPSSLGIPSFRVLNLPTEAEYETKQLTVGGGFVRFGRMPVHGFKTLVNDPGFDTTRFLHFDFHPESAALDRCYYQGGDSGAPSFIMTAGEAALVGTASGRDPINAQGQIDPQNQQGRYRNYMAFIPAYLNELDALMEGHGYHIRRVNAAATSTGATLSPTGSLRRMKAGSVVVALANQGSAAAHNVVVRLVFSAAPATVAGTGWICDAESPLVWNCRRGGLAGAQQSVIHASWTMLPASASLSISSTRSHDGSAAQETNVTLPLLETYTSWIQGAQDTAQSSDPDRDGISNLLEYASGGSPSTPSQIAQAGHRQLPRVERSGNRVRVRFPRRTDAAARGLSDVIEYSPNLGSASWQTSPPGGTTVTAGPFSPDSDGFEEVTVDLPVAQGPCFVRLRTTLTE